MAWCIESTKGKWIDMFQFKISRRTFTKWIIWGILFWFIIPDSALADNTRPAYLEIEELASGNIRVVYGVGAVRADVQHLTPGALEGGRDLIL